MVCKLAVRFGGMPSDWAAHDQIWLDTMISLAAEQDAEQEQRRREG